MSVSSCHSGARSLSLAVVTLSPPPSPGDVYLQGDSGAGLRRAWGPERPTRAPTFCSSWGGGQGLPGSAFVFPTPITFAEVLPARGTPRLCPAPRGCQAAPGQRAETREPGGAHPAAGARRRLGSPGGAGPLTWRRSAARDAGNPVPGVRGGGSGRRGGGGPARAQHVGRAARSCPGAAAAGGRADRRGGWMRAGWGERRRWPGAAAARPSVRSSSRSGPGPGLAAAAAFARDRLDPFQG